MAANTNPLLTVSALSLFTEDLATTKAFHIRTFGASVVFEDDVSCALQFSNLIINLLAASSGEDLVKPAKVAAPDSGKRFQLTIWVDDLDSELAKLKEKGVQLSTGPETKPWGMRVVTFEDPGGHSWEVAQKL